MYLQLSQISANIMEENNSTNIYNQTNSLHQHEYDEKKHLKQQLPFENQTIINQTQINQGMRDKQWNDFMFHENLEMNNKFQNLTHMYIEDLDSWFSPFRTIWFRVERIDNTNSSLSWDDFMDEERNYTLKNKGKFMLTHPKYKITRDRTFNGESILHKYQTPLVNKKRKIKIPDVQENIVDTNFLQDNFIALPKPSHLNVKVEEFRRNPTTLDWYWQISNVSSTSATDKINLVTNWTENSENCSKIRKKRQEESSVQKNEEENEEIPRQELSPKKALMRAKDRLIDRIRQFFMGFKRKKPPKTTKKTTRKTTRKPKTRKPTKPKPGKKTTRRTTRRTTRKPTKRKPGKPTRPTTTRKYTPLPLNTFRTRTIPRHNRELTLKPLYATRIPPRGWHLIGADDVWPSNAFIAGRGFDGERLYVGRAWLNDGSILPGYIVEGDTCVRIALRQGHCVKPYEILAGGYLWRFTSKNTQRHPNAVVAGFQRTPHVSYITVCRSTDFRSFGNFLMIGKTSTDQFCWSELAGGLETHRWYFEELLGQWR